MVVTAGIVVLPFSLSVANSNQFVFGNFQSYMSQDVMNRLEEKYNINWQYYGTNAEIPTYIKNKTLNIAVATNNMVAQLAIQKEIQPIDWSKFNLFYTDPKDPQNEIKVDHYWQLENIVTPAVWNLCQDIAVKAGFPSVKDPATGDEHLGNLLEYCIPYFMQTFVFAYRGPEIAELQKPDVSFKDIFSYITNTSIPNNRFLGGNSKVMMIKDARTVYDISKLINYANNPIPQNRDINPSSKYLMHYDPKLNDNTLAPSTNQIVSNYDHLATYYRNVDPNTITFNSDSGIVLNKLASRQIEGAFLYNGDAVYSAAGGDVADGGTNLPDFSDNPESANEMHVVVPKDNLVAMDAVVFNKSLTGSKLDEAYKIVQQVCLSGLNPGEDIGETDADGNYKYLSMQNFDFVNYTPCYQKLYDYALNDYFGPVAGDTPEEIEENNLHHFQAKLLTINPDMVSSNSVEMPLNELTESNMNLAFETFIDKV